MAGKNGYSVKLSKDRKSVLISWGEAGKTAEYAVGSNPKAEISAWRRQIDNHLKNGGTLDNYQW
jgi:hypothetical protein